MYQLAKKETEKTIGLILARSLRHKGKNSKERERKITKTHMQELKGEKEREREITQTHMQELKVERKRKRERKKTMNHNK